MEPELSSAEAVQKAKEAAAAAQKANQDQIEASNRDSEARITKAFTEALKQAFSTDLTVDGQKRFIDITRIPLICQSIIGIDSRLDSIEGNIKWGVRLVIGGVIVGVVTMLMPHFTNLLG